MTYLPVPIQCSGGNHAALYPEGNPDKGDCLICSSDRAFKMVLDSEKFALLRIQTLESALKFIVAECNSGLEPRVSAEGCLYSIKKKSSEVLAAPIEAHPSGEFAQPSPLERTSVALDNTATFMTDLLSALDWEGGSFADAIEEIKRLRTERALIVSFLRGEQGGIVNRTDFDDDLLARVAAKFADAIERGLHAPIRRKS